MNKINFKKISTIIFPIILLTFVSCSNVDKETIISENVSTDIKVEENEVKTYLKKGDESLKSNNLTQAKLYFEKAISIDKSNKDTYIYIKDQYMNIAKFDDAYSTIKLAVDNNVDIENMNILLQEIANNFEVISYNKKVYPNTPYTLPTEITTTVNEVETIIPIKWTTTNVDTSTPGNYSFTGKNDSYGRKVVVNLNVLENVYDERIGYVRNVYTANGKTYIDVDEVEWFSGLEAHEEAKKDGLGYYDENGTYVYVVPYLIRDNYHTITTYELTENAEFYLINYDFPNFDRNNLENAAIPKKASFEDFKNLIMRNKEYEDNRLTLCWIHTLNGKAYKVAKQYTP